MSIVSDQIVICFRYSIISVDHLSTHTGHVRNHHVIVEAALTRGRPSQTSLKRILRHNIRSRFTEEGALPTQMIPGRDKRASAPKTMVLHGNRAMLHLLVESCAACCSHQNCFAVKITGFKQSSSHFATLLIIINKQHLEVPEHHVVVFAKRS